MGFAVVGTAVAAAVVEAVVAVIKDYPFYCLIDEQLSEIRALEKNKRKLEDKLKIFFVNLS